MSDNAQALGPHDLTEQEREAMSACAARMEEQLAPIVEKFVGGAAKKIQDSIIDGVIQYTTRWLEEDASCNFSDHLRKRVQGVVCGLLNGSMDDAAAAEWLGGMKSAEFRRKVYERHRDIVVSELTDELLAQNKRYREDEEFRRRMGRL